MRLPAPRVSLLLVALGGALVLGHPNPPADGMTTVGAPAVVYQTSSSGNAAYAADLPLDDPGTVALR